MANHWLKVFNAALKLPPPNLDKSYKIYQVIFVVLKDMNLRHL